MSKYRSNYNWRLAWLGRLLLLVAVLFASLNFSVGGTVTSVKAADIAALTSANIGPVQVKHKGTPIGRAASNTTLQLTISLQERDARGETQFISDLYNPRSPYYHQYITPDEYATRFGPTPAARTQVANYLQNHGFVVTNNDARGSLIEFEGPVGAVESAFQVQINNYRAADGRIFYGNDVTPSYPQALTSLINGVVGLSNENLPQSHLVRGKSDPRYGSAPGGGYSAYEVRNAYNVSSLLASGYDGAGQKVALFELDGYDPANIQVYTTTYGINAPALANVFVDGATITPGGGQVEVELDIEAVLAVAPKAQVYVYIATGDGSSYLDLYQRIATDNLTQQISSSWGNYNENDTSLLLSEAQIFRQYAIQGQSFYTASGDIGSDYYNTGKQDGDPEDNPYVTSVGGTRLYLSGVQTTSTYVTETTWNDSYGRGSTGGISTYFSKTMTPWQTGPGTDLSGTFNPSGGRQEPDVAALGDPAPGFGVYSEGSWFPVGGTSLSSPLWAGFTAVMNQWSLLHGGTLIGFPSPSLYTIFNNPTQYAQDFHDITVGGNDYHCPNQAYPAVGPGSCTITTTAYYSSTVGYDLVTGIGTPNVANLVSDLSSVSTSNHHLLLDPAQLNLGNANSGYPVSQVITLSTITNSVTYSSTATPAWLNISPTSGTIAANSSQPVTVSTNPASLSAGVYSATVVFVNTAFPITDSVSLHVTFTVAAPTLTANPTSLSFRAGPNSSTNPPSQVVSVTYSSNSPASPTLTWTATTNATWLTVTPISNTLSVNSSGYITANVNLASLSSGTYSGTISLTSSIGLTASVAVNLKVLYATSAILSSVPNPSTFGQAVTFITTIGTGAPAAATGTVTFTDSISGTLGTAPVGASGIATYTTSALTAGTHIITASYSGDTNNAASVSSPLTQTVIPTGLPPSNYTYYLPFLANGQNSFTTYPVFQNIGTISATVTITFYDSSGNPLATQPTLSSGCNPVPANGECILPNPYTATSSGSAIIVSPQPLNVIIPEATTYGGSAYAIGSGAAPVLIAPLALNNTFGDFKTQILVYNGGNNPASVTLNFFDSSGNPAPASSSLTVTIAPHTSKSFDQSAVNSGLPNGFNGWAQLTGNDANSQTLVAQVLEQSASRKFVAIANAQTTSYSTVFAPAIFNKAYGAFTTGANIVNPGSSPVTVTVTYYDLNGIPTATFPFILNAHAIAQPFQGASSGNGIPTGGLPMGYTGAALVSVTGGGVVMTVNEDGGLTSTGNARSGTYAATGGGSGKVGLPVIANGAFGGYITGDTIQNTTGSTVNASITFYNLNGTLALAAQSFSVGPYASKAFYQGVSSLPAGFYGTAVVTQSSGPANALVVTTNAQSDALFYTYIEPSS